MAFLANRTINLLNLHYAIHSIALGGGAAFVSAFLLKSGIAPPTVLGAVALILAIRFVLRPIAIGFAIRFGLRQLLMAGSVLSALQYPVLAEVDTVGAVLAAFCLVGALGDTVYWSSYHAYFASVGDDDHRGKHVGTREAIAATIGIVSPLAAGWMLTEFGPRLTFAVTAVAVALSALPLAWTPQVAVAPKAPPGALKAALPGVLIFMGDGFLAAGYHFVWQIALFTALGSDLIAFGGALALAALVGAVGGLVLGSAIDAGHGKRAVTIGVGAIALVALLRAAATGDATLAIAANALGALAGCLYVPAVMTAAYTLGRRAPCTFRFYVAAEGGWDIGGTLGLTIAAGLVFAGVPLWYGVLLALAGAVFVHHRARLFYAANPKTLVQPAGPPLIVDPIEGVSR
ncbi:MAG: hypothetical protein IT548_13725 [Alphaproteobacteria bacterium]|nr:hypothetical protein [Alphaproteobacteria bacterium]